MCASSATDRLAFQCGGFAPVPEALKNQKNKLMNIFGNNAHMIAAKTDNYTMFWKCAVSNSIHEAWQG